MPRQIGDRAQSHELEPCELRNLLEIGLRDVRADRWTFSKTHPIGKPEQPREVPVIQRDDHTSTPAERRAYSLEEPLNIRRVVEVSVEQDDVDRVGPRRSLREVL